MKTHVLELSLVLLAVACGGSDATGGCETYAAAYCRKLFHCRTADAQAVYTSEAGCRSTVGNDLGCSSLSSNPCPSGQKLDSSGLEQCVSDTNDQDCVSFSRSTPASCDADLLVCR